MDKISSSCPFRGKYLESVPHSFSGIPGQVLMIVTGPLTQLCWLPGINSHISHLCSNYFLKVFLLFYFKFWEKKQGKKNNSILEEMKHALGTWDVKSKKKILSNIILEKVGLIITSKCLDFILRS